MKKIILMLMALVVFIVGCGNSSFVDIDSTQFKDLIEDEEVFVLDVHTPEQDHIEGTDGVIPYDKIEENLDKLPEDKNTKIAVYCRSGSMSKESSQKLIDLGYKNVFNLVGGRNAYVTQFSE